MGVLGVQPAQSGRTRCMHSPTVTCSSPRCPYRMLSCSLPSCAVLCRAAGSMGCAVSQVLLVVHAGAHRCFSSVTVTGPLATNVPDLMLLYAAMCNTDYPKGARASDSDSLSGLQGTVGAHPVGVAAAAAVRAPALRPLELPQQLPGSAAALSDRPLAGLRVGIPRQVCCGCKVLFQPIKYFKQGCRTSMIRRDQLVPWLVS
jgi:hypothetical protein